MLKNISKWVKNRSGKQKLILFIILIGLMFGGYKILFSSKKGVTQYVTEAAVRGNLITSISGSGTISSGNYTDVNTKASGVVAKVYVANGDMVKKGQKIADITLDDYARERQTTSRVTYLDTLISVKESQNTKATSDIDMWKARQDVLDAQEAVDDMEDNDTNPATHEVYTDGERAIIYKTLDQSKLAFSVAEARYLNADANIASSRARVDAALRSYQESSSGIISPADGIISDLLLAEGLVLNADSTTSNTSGATIVSAQTVGRISSPKAQLMATVDMSEIDVISIKAGQKVTLSLDAYPDVSITGKVLAVNTSGAVSSGVTTYPVTILLDPVDLEIYPNMAVNVNIITSIKTDVVLVASTAVSTLNGTSTVQVKKNGKYETVQVEIGDSNDSQTEIKSGITEGDEVVTSVITPQTSSASSTTTSPFSGFGASGRSTTGSSGVNRTIIMQGAPPGF